MIGVKEHLNLLAGKSLKGIDVDGMERRASRILAQGYILNLLRGVNVLLITSHVFEPVLKSSEHNEG